MKFVMEMAERPVETVPGLCVNLCEKILPKSAKVWKIREYLLIAN